MLFLLVDELVRTNFVTGMGGVGFVPLTVLLEVFVGFAVLYSSVYLGCPTIG